MLTLLPYEDETGEADSKRWRCLGGGDWVNQNSRITDLQKGLGVEIIDRNVRHSQGIQRIQRMNEITASYDKFACNLIADPRRPTTVRNSAWRAILGFAN